MNQTCLLGRIEKSKEWLSEGVLNSHFMRFRLLFWYSSSHRRVNFV